MSAIWYVLSTGYTVEVAAIQTENVTEEGNLIVMSCAEVAITNPDQETVFEGQVKLRHETEFAVGPQLMILLAVLKALLADQMRVVYPHRYDDPNDRGLVIANSSERVASWLRIMSNDFDQSINQMGSPRLARQAYDASQYIW